MKCDLNAVYRNNISPLLLFFFSKLSLRSAGELNTANSNHFFKVTVVNKIYPFSNRVWANSIRGRAVQKSKEERKSRAKINMNRVYFSKSLVPHIALKY